MENLLGLFVAILCVVVVLKFISFCIRARTVRYQDWAREQKRLQLLETVRKVRTEMGDYENASPRKHRAPSPRKAVRRGVKSTRRK